jgi:U32 family peptidase
MKKPLLMMPAGNLEKLKIAVKNGADAVYFGASKFNMRNPAQNFSREELKEGIDYCHAFGAEAYITLNIALKDSEIEEAIELTKELYEFGADALIIQDFGLLKALKKLLPELKIHASTQLTCNNKQGAIFLAEQGFSKIVLARELSIKEIKEITEALEGKAETEIFVHGAECFSYSGQCLFSSFAFNKSGNRGMCLQPCRLKFETSTGKKGRILSMKDLATYDIVDKLVETGVGAFKVEGRLKSEEYIQNVARVYRKAIDNCFGEKKEITKGELLELKKSYSRDNSSLYLTNEKERTTMDTVGNLGLEVAEVISFHGQKVMVNLLEDLSRSDKLTRIIDSNYESFLITKMFSFNKPINFARKGQTITLEVSKRPYLEKGQKLYLTSPKRFEAGKKLSLFYEMFVEEKNKKLLVKINIPKLKKTKFKSQYEIQSDFELEEAKNKAIDQELLKEKLFNEYYFYSPKKFGMNLRKNKFIPLSKLKEFKRKINSELTGFENKKIDNKLFEEEKRKLFNFKKKTKEEKMQKETFIFLEEKQETIFDKTRGLEGKKIFYYGEEGKNNFEKEARVKAQNIQSSKELEEFEKKAVEKNWLVVVSNVGSLQIALKNKLDFFIDREMNSYNSLAVDFFVELGAEKIVPSIELSFTELSRLAHQDKIIALLFYYPLLMTSRAYAEDNIFKKTKFTLIDRKEFEYKVRISNGLFKLYNPLPVDMLYELNRFTRFASRAIDLKESSLEEAIKVLKYYVARNNKQDLSKKSKFTRGHYNNPVD